MKFVYGAKFNRVLYEKNPKNKLINAAKIRENEVKVYIKFHTNSQVVRESNRPCAPPKLRTCCKCGHIAMSE